jgi:hypothetical protein
MRLGVTFMGIASAFILALLCFVPAGLWLYGVPVPGSGKDRTPVPSLATIQAMSELAAIRVHIQDALEGENGHYQGTWEVHGEVILGIDLAKIAYASTDPVKRQATLRLPPPHLVSTKVDHERSRELSVKTTAWLPTSSRQNLRDEAWMMADRKLQRLGQEPKQLKRARAETERILSDLFGGMGWTVAFEWQEDARLAGR